MIKEIIWLSGAAEDFQALDTPASEKGFGFPGVGFFNIANPTVSRNGSAGWKTSGCAAFDPEGIASVSSIPSPDLAS
ncbi:MAG: hypothetical protein R3F11_17475 [Verrucomicrobiales bacterium]